MARSIFFSIAFCSLTVACGAAEPTMPDPGPSGPSSGSPPPSASSTNTAPAPTHPVTPPTPTATPDSGAPLSDAGTTPQDSGPQIGGPIGSCTNPNVANDNGACTADAIDSSQKPANMNCQPQADNGQATTYACTCQVTNKNGSQSTTSFTKDDVCGDARAIALAFIEYCGCQ